MIFDILAATVATLSIMFLLWLIHLKIKNAGIVDIGWSGNFTLIALIYFFLGDGYVPRKALITIMAVFWSARLTIYLYKRVVGHEEEGRYLQLRQEWQGNIHLKFLFFFLFQGGLNMILSLPFLLANQNPKPELSWLEFAAVAIWLVALTGESVADAQLQRFKSDPANRGKVCKEGLWRYSRHPNYFFEWLIWLAFFAFALTSPYGWTALVCPLLMLYFLFKVTGIPATEEQAIRTKGDAYREYQKSTSVFMPWFPKKTT